EMRQLNRRHRGLDRPTNVLSFSADAAIGPWLGDVALGAEIVGREARRQGKRREHHLGHLVVHGVLHLLGHDHHAPGESRRMEGLERRILARLGIGDPYRVRRRS
ncbi:MAG: rRNA maturation RNase YbeY, partial [Alphaproteobacteria bacterium]|nr:rRNA maturation RNase YbeY [Alphaproteobacteria bacterium]